MKVSISDVLQPPSILRDVQDIVNKMGYSLSQFTCETEQADDEMIIKIKRGNNQIAYRQPNDNTHIAQAVTWSTEFMGDLESGKYE